MTEADQPLLVDVRGPVAWLTINRPSRLNAMDSCAHLALSEALDRLADAQEVRVLVLAGAGERAFSVGRDLHELSAELPEAEQAIIADRWTRVTRLTDRTEYPKPIIARVQGHALGGGFELALACDIIVASDDARFALPEARRGLIPFAGGVHRLPRQVPLKTAMGLMLTGRSLTARRAFDLGLVNEVVPAAELDAAVEQWTADIVACAPLSVAAIRQNVARGLALPLADALAASFPAEEARLRSNDAREGPKAFAEKRQPHWSGT